MKIQNSVSDIRYLCIKNNWFTNGGNRQYETMFQRVEEGADVEEIATIIWICSVNVTREEIIQKLTYSDLPHKRIEFVKAMDLIACAVNDAHLYMDWALGGVAECDNKNNSPDYELEHYTEDATFAKLMKLFLDVMNKAQKNCGLCFDEIYSK